MWFIVEVKRSEKLQPNIMRLFYLKDIKAKSKMLLEEENMKFDLKLQF